jgi:hypothetical protein
MSLPSIEEVKKVAASRQQARLAQASVNRPVSTLPPSPPRHDVESLLSSSGTNIAQLQKLRDEYRSEMRKLADQNAAKAILQSTSLQHSLAAMLAAKSQAAQFVPSFQTRISLSSPLRFSSGPLSAFSWTTIRFSPTTIGRSCSIKPRPPAPS